MDLPGFKKVIREGRFEWRQHTLERLIERAIPSENILQVLSSGEVIEDYPEDTPYPSALFLGFIEERPLHVVAAFDAAGFWAYIITAYVPDSDHFENDFKTRIES